MSQNVIFNCFLLEKFCCMYIKFKIEEKQLKLDGDISYEKAIMDRQI